MHLLVLICLCLCLCHWYAVSAQQQYVYVNTSSSSLVKGFAMNDTDSFLGIRYALPPIGDLRFAAPRAVNSGVVPEEIDATAYSSICMQPASSFFDLKQFSQDEDCLSLNIYRPSHLPADGTRLPVMVWFHGGSLVQGAGRSYASELLSVRANVIVVTVNYRLGVFGFLVVPELLSSAEWKNNQNPLNFGFLDQEMALQWVHDNIASFQGDPNNVLIFGESAGGAAVEWHILAEFNITTPLFHKAIIESAAMTIPSWVLPTSLSKGDDLLQQTNCTTATAASPLACLRALSATSLVSLSQPLGPLNPTIDLARIVDRPSLLFRHKKYHRVPVLLGHTSFEGSTFVFMAANAVYGLYQPAEILNLTASQYDGVLRYWIHVFPENTIQAVLAWYHHLIPELGYYGTASRLLGDMFFNCDTEFLSDTFFFTDNVYRYLFAHTTPAWSLSWLGATHMSELFYLFQPDRIYGSDVVDHLSAEEKLLSDTMIAYWKNFAWHSDPTGHTESMAEAGAAPALVEWPEYVREDKSSILVLDTPSVHLFGQQQSSDRDLWNLCPNWLFFQQQKEPENLDMLSLGGFWNVSVAFDAESATCDLDVTLDISGNTIKEVFLSTGKIANYYLTQVTDPPAPSASSFAMMGHARFYSHDTGCGNTQYKYCEYCFSFYHPSGDLTLIRYNLNRTFPSTCSQQFQEATHGTAACGKGSGIVATRGFCDHGKCLPGNGSSSSNGLPGYGIALIVIGSVIALVIIGHHMCAKKPNTGTSGTTTTTGMPIGSESGVSFNKLDDAPNNVIHMS
eukprot:TRINITY_DN1169_c0_g1_i1.p1 TRINITY_DN1169_c0_g1~~TRINITY_DN1169_c0_g1_i1.p1  ORF type:complete len:792 (-),score=191.01 TRINITY_DN1169_c0_g1_i1:159-2534(-)